MTAPELRRETHVPVCAIPTWLKVWAFTGLLIGAFMLPTMARELGEIEAVIEAMEAATADIEAENQRIRASISAMDAR